MGKENFLSNQHKPTKNQLGAQSMNVIFRDSEVWFKELTQMKKKKKKEFTQMFLNNGILKNKSWEKIPKRSPALVLVLIRR